MNNGEIILQKIFKEYFPDFNIELYEDYGARREMIVNLSTKISLNHGEPMTNIINRVLDKLNMDGEKAQELIDKDLEKSKRIAELEAEIKSLKSNPLASCLNLEIT